jgi:hypothetical protein
MIYDIHDVAGHECHLFYAYMYLKKVAGCVNGSGQKVVVEEAQRSLKCHKSILNILHATTQVWIAKVQLVSKRIVSTIEFTLLDIDLPTPERFEQYIPTSSYTDT